MLATQTRADVRIPYAERDFRTPSSNSRPTAKCRSARTRSDYEAAFQILYESYLRTRLCEPNLAGMRIVPHHFWDRTQIFVCELGDEIVGTVALVLDEPSWGTLPVESIFPTEVQAEREQASKLAELTSLAVSPRHAKMGGELFARLTSTAIHFARRQGVDRAVATVHPRHAKVYQRVMGFDRIGKTESYESVRGNPASLIATWINVPERVSKPFRHWYFEDRFTQWQLCKTNMTLPDQLHFRAAEAECGGIRQNAPGRLSCFLHIGSQGQAATCPSGGG